MTALPVATILDAMLRLRPDAAPALSRFAEMITNGEMGPRDFCNAIKCVRTRDVKRLQPACT